MTISLSALRAAGFNVPGIDRQVNPTSQSKSSSNLSGHPSGTRTRPNITKNQTPQKRTTKMLSYPTGLGDNDQGHWILFEILGQNKGQLKAAKDKERQARESAAAASSEYGDFRGDPTGLGQVVNRDQTPSPDKEEKWHERSPDANLLNSSIQMKKKSTTRLDTVIALYMPPSVQVKYDVSWADQEIGVVAESGLAAIKAFQGQGGGLSGMMSAGKEAVLGGTAAAARGVMNKVASTVQGADAVIAIERGQVITPRMELMFEGMGRRSFSYSFTFIPKSESEAITVEDIVLHFKRHMMPNFANNFTSGVDGVREMTIPDHFNIRYMYRHKTNTHLNLIHTCALKSMDVDYGAERFTGYAGGRPQTTKISLNFIEFNIMSRAHIDQGY